jgi:aminoglycoside phosphotransferase (APT) family kinase protein
MQDPGELVASGRDSNIYAVANGHVLRRARDGRSQVEEARTMEFVRSQGIAVPEVISVSEDGIDLVMTRIEGPTMIEAASAQPWKLRRFGRILADFHQSLHELEAPAWLPDAPTGTGSRFLHMDLHPLNVVLSPTGPVLLDWTRASRGDPLVDVATTWVLLAAGEVTGSRLDELVTKVGRNILLKSFLKPFPRADVATRLAEVVEWKSQDPHMAPSEVARMRALL